MAEYRVALFAGILSFAVSSVSAFGQGESGRGYIGGGLSLTQPLGGSGGATIRPWIHGESANSGQGFAGSDLFGSGGSLPSGGSTSSGPGLGGGGGISVGGSGGISVGGSSGISVGGSSGISVGGLGIGGIGLKK
jgi:hypothetical protein